jgi:hypothetical protein
MYAHQHPWHGGALHPWDDQSTPQSPTAPRPDIDLAALNGTGPRPEEFPFDVQGQRSYYTAVSAEAGRRRHAHQMQIAERLRIEEEAAARRAALLLLS